MALTKNGLFSLINANLPDNNSGEISPADTREVTTQVADSALNTLETSPQTLASPLDVQGALTASGNLVATGARYVLKARSASFVDQNPTGLNIETKISFGAGDNLTSADVTILADGSIVFNTTGSYLVTALLSPGRGSGAGSAILLARFKLNGVVASRTAGFKMTDLDSAQGSLFDVPFNATAGDVLEAVMIRDSSGNNSGGLISLPSSAGWEVSPSASASIYKLETFQ